MAEADLVVSYLHPGEVSHSFHRSLVDYLMFDLAHDRRLAGLLFEECGTSRVIEGRNSVVRKFLASDAQWLMMVDADMGFDRDAIDRLLDVADPQTRPVVGGLCFGQRKGPEVSGNARRMIPVPTIYRWHDTDSTCGFAPVYSYPEDTLVACDGTGAAFLLVHRRVLESLGETFAVAHPREWFDDTVYKGTVVGEDLTFCRRVAEAGFPIHVHTGVGTSHLKQVYYERSLLGDLTDVPTYVVVPVKNRLDLTTKLVNQLRQQGGYDALMVMDNGSNRETRNWLDSQPDVERFDCPDMNIHQMWNLGLNEAVSRSWPCNVAILNNDLNLGPNMLHGLSEALRTDPMVAAVCPNYDGRPGSGIQYVTDICAGRYDGTGGFAGFAFMVKGESGYRFPEDLQWWGGDNDMLLSIDRAGVKAAIVLDVTVEHVDGGGQTGNWDDPEMKKVLDADLAKLRVKWSRVLQPVA